MLKLSKHAGHPETRPVSELRGFKRWLIVATVPTSGAILVIGEFVADARSPW